MKNLWFSCHFLFAGLLLSISALTQEECQPLVKPVSLDDPSMMFSRVNFIMGYTDNDLFNAILKQTDSSWIEITKSGASEVLMVEYNKINGTCFSSKFNVTLDGNTATGSLTNITSAFHLLPSCDGCLVFYANTTARNLNKFLQAMNLEATHEEEIVARSLYLMGKEATIKDSDLEHFKKQASCLSFSREPDFHHDPKKEFCKESESVHMSVS